MSSEQLKENPGEEEEKEQCASRSSSPAAPQDSTSVAAVRPFKKNELSTEGEPQSIFEAVHKGDIEAIRAFLNQGVDIQSRDSRGFTALHCASESGDVGAVAVLLGAGASLSARGANMNTPLHLASACGNVKVARALIKAKANVNLVNWKKQTPLMLACIKGHVGMVKLLLKNGGDVSKIDTSGFSPLTYAVKEGNEAVLSVLLYRGAYFELCDRENRIALHCAAENGFAEIIRKLIRNGANLKSVNSMCQSALHLASQNGHLQIVEILLQNGLDCNSIDNRKQSALHLAAEKGNVKLIRRLLKAGANPSLVDSENNKPIDIAAKNGKEDAVWEFLDVLPEDEDVWSLPGLSRNYSDDTARYIKKIIENDTLNLKYQSNYSNSEAADSSKKSSGPMHANNSFAAMPDTLKEKRNLNLSSDSVMERVLAGYKSSVENLHPQHVQQSVASFCDSVLFGGGDESHAQQPADRNDQNTPREEVNLCETINTWKTLDVKASELPEEQARTEELYRKVRGILNRLTPQKFQTLVTQVQTLPIDNSERLQGVVNLIFDKAIDEPGSSVVYAEMCKVLSNMQVSVERKDENSPPEFVNFRKLIVTRCQQEFEKNTEEELYKAERLKEIANCKDPVRKKELQLQFEEESTKVHIKSVGNIRFIGELYKLQMLTTTIMHRCIRQLLGDGEEESLESVCVLLTTVGKDLEVKNQDLTEYFDKMKQISQKHGEISSRVRFMLQDVAELRRKKWVPKRDENNPKTIYQIRKESEREAVMEPLNASTPSGNRRKRGSKGGDRGINEYDCSAASQSRNYSVDTTKLKQKMMETGSLSLGCRSSYIHQNSKSETANTGKKSSSGVYSNNSLAAVKDMPEEKRNSSLSSSRPSSNKLAPSASSEKERMLAGYKSSAEELPPQHMQQSRSSSHDNAPHAGADDSHGRVSGTPAGEDSNRGSPEISPLASDVPVMTDNLTQLRQNKQVHTRVDKNHKTIPKEPEKADVMDALDGNPLLHSQTAHKKFRRKQQLSSSSWYFAQRGGGDESHSRGYGTGSPEISPLASYVPVMADNKIKEKTVILLCEYFSCSNAFEIAQSLAESFGEAYIGAFVYESLNYVLDKSVVARQNVVKLMCFLIKEKVVTTSVFCTSFSQVVSEGDDLVIDVPKIWLYLAEIIVPLLSAEVISLSAFGSIAKGVGKFVVEVLQLWIKDKGPAWIREQWVAAGLTWTHFVDPSEVDSFVKQNNVEFTIENGVPSQLSAPLSMEEVQKKLLQFLKPEKGSAHSFDETCDWIGANVGKRVKEPQFICALMTALHKCCSSYTDPSKQVGKGVALKSPTSFFTALREGEDEREES